MGSIDYAVEHLGSNLKVIVVLGHSQCGAVTAAVDSFLQPVEYLGLASSHHIRSIVNAIFPAVRGAALSLSRMWGDEVSELPGFRAALIECSVIFNAALTASILGKSFSEPTKDRRVVFGVYDLGTRRVHVPLSPERGKEPIIGLQEASSTSEELREFAAQHGDAHSPGTRGLPARRHGVAQQTDRFPTRDRGKDRQGSSGCIMAKLGEQSLADLVRFADKLSTDSPRK